MSQGGAKVRRKIIRIDEEKCDGCGACVPACVEAALRIVEGKARLVKEIFCDGLGACLGKCPQDAISIEEREADAFDEKATHEHMERQRAVERSCPGASERSWDAPAETTSSPPPSALRQWPVQIRLVAPQAPFLKGAELLVCADCVPFAHAGLHDSLLAGRRVLVGCPKFDDLQACGDKLSAIFAAAKPKAITVAVMEVPCCQGLVHAVREAGWNAGLEIEPEVAVITMEGAVQK